MSRRSRRPLAERVSAASTNAERALDLFELALFHDNNSRETEAIPHYEAALAHGLSGERHAECLAWLASSLYKTGRLEEALDRLHQARELTSSSELTTFLRGLERRILQSVDSMRIS